MKSKKIISILSFLIISFNLFCLDNEISNFSNNNTIKKDFNFLGSKEYFALDPLSDALIIGIGGGLLCTDFVLEKIDIKSSKSNYSEPDKADIWAFDRLIMNPYNKTFDYLSTGLEVSCLLLPLICFPKDKSECFTIYTMYFEALLWAHTLKSLAKTFVHKPRPYMYFENYPEKFIKDGDWDCSFFSGHSCLSFMAASFTSYVYCKYNENSQYKWAVISASYALSTTVAVFRLLSGNHFLSDVITGATVGSLVGLAIPLLHEFKIIPKIKNNKVELALSPLGFACNIRL